MLVVLLTALLSADVEVRSTFDCPSSAQISEHLAGLLPTPAPAHRAELRPQDGAFRLLLWREDGSLLGDRSLVLTGTCAERAEMVAVLLASWESAPETGVSLAAPPAPSPAPSAPSPPAPAPLAMDVSLGAGAVLGNSLAAAGRLEWGVGRLGSPWRARVASASQTARSRSLDVGQVDWSHTLFGLGVARLLTTGPWYASLDVDAVLGWATLAGRGFAENRTARSLEFGAEAGLRLGHAWGRVLLWTEARAVVWRQQQRAVVDGLGQDDLRSWDVTASAGLTVSLFP